MSVIASQSVAHDMYKKFGFREIGKKEKEQKVGDQYYDEYLMELLLSKH